MWRLRWFLFSNIHYAIVIDEIKAIITSKGTEPVRLCGRLVVEFQIQHYGTSQGAQSGVDDVVVFRRETAKVNGK